MRTASSWTLGVLGGVLGVGTSMASALALVLFGEFFTPARLHLPLSLGLTPDEGLVVGAALIVANIATLAVLAFLLLRRRSAAGVPVYGNATEPGTPVYGNAAGLGAGAPASGNATKLGVGAGAPGATPGPGTASSTTLTDASAPSPASQRILAFFCALASWPYKAAVVYELVIMVLALAPSLLADSASQGGVATQTVYLVIALIVSFMQVAVVYALGVVWTLPALAQVGRQAPSLRTPALCMLAELPGIDLVGCLILGITTQRS